jgi:hypothetical protein
LAQAAAAAAHEAAEAAAVEIAVLRAALAESEADAAALRAAATAALAAEAAAIGGTAQPRPLPPSPTAARAALLRVDTTGGGVSSSGEGRVCPAAAYSSPLGRPPMHPSPHPSPPHLSRGSKGDEPFRAALVAEAASHAAEMAELNRGARAAEEALRREVTKCLLTCQHLSLAVPPSLFFSLPFSLF